MVEENNRITMHLDDETNKKLEFLRRELDSPKKWIVRRLVDQEVKRLTHSKKLEVVSR